MKDTRERLQNVTKDVKLKTAEYNTAKIKSEEYLEEIIHKATQVESLKTQVGQNLAIKAILDNQQFTNFLNQADNKELLANGNAINLFYINSCQTVYFLKETFEVVLFPYVLLML